MAWLNPGVKVKSKSQLINNLMIACIALVLTFMAIMALNLWHRSIMAALGPIPSPYHNK